jgi:hypothetical protein
MSPVGGALLSTVKVLKGHLYTLPGKPNALLKHTTFCVHDNASLRANSSSVVACLE